MLASSISISSLAGLYGLSLRTLRFYEERGLLQPMRVGTARHYTAKDKVRLELIIKGKKLGFSLSEIEALILERKPAATAKPVDGLTDTLSIGEVRRQLKMLEQRRKHLDEAIEELRRVMVSHCEHRAMENA